MWTTAQQVFVRCICVCVNTRPDPTDLTQTNSFSPMNRFSRGRIRSWMVLIYHHPPLYWIKYLYGSIVQTKAMCYTNGLAWFCAPATVVSADIKKCCTVWWVNVKRHPTVTLCLLSDSAPVHAGNANTNSDGWFCDFCVSDLGMWWSGHKIHAIT